MEEFFPFGSAVHFLRSNTIKKDDRPPKFAPTGASGVILGYRLHPGCKWRHEYIVAELDAFVDVDFRFDANPKQTPKVRTQIVQEVRKPEGETTFPLRERYLRFNATIEGAITAAGKDVQDELAGNPLVEPLRVGDDTVVEDAPGSSHIIADIFKGPQLETPGQSSTDPAAAPQSVVSGDAAGGGPTGSTATDERTRLETPQGVVPGDAAGG